MVTATNRIRSLREQRGLTQEELGELSGVDQATISKLERFRLSNPLYATLNSIARVLGVPTDALMVQMPLKADRRKAERRTGVTRRANDRRTGLERRERGVA